MPPFVESSPLDTEVVINDSVSLSCSASGVPLPNITWSRTGYGELMNSTNYLITNVQGDSITSLLTVVSAMQGDTGHYNCTAENSVGRDSATFYIQVQGMSVVHSVLM